MMLRRAPGISQSALQQVYGHPPRFIQRLADCRQAEVVGHVHIIETDDRYLVRDGQAAFVSGFEHAQRLGVTGGKNRVGRFG